MSDLTVCPVCGTIGNEKVIYGALPPCLKQVCPACKLNFVGGMVAVIVDLEDADPSRGQIYEVELASVRRQFPAVFSSRAMFPLVPGNIPVLVVPYNDNCRISAVNPFSNS
jgi:hypothetical protein